MTVGPTNYFLLIYNLDTRDVEVKEFASNGRAAAAAYTEHEHAVRADEDIEVVLVGADSLETIKQTHSHYFVKTTGDLFDELIRELSTAER